MNLNELFDGADVEEKPRTPWVKFDRKTQFIKFRFLEDLDDLKADTRNVHKVDGVGFSVRCNLHPIADKKTGGIFLWDGYSEKGTVNKKPEYNCVFCAEQRAAKKAAVDEFGDKTPEGKAAVIQAGKLHSRTQQFIANVEYEVMEKKPGKKQAQVVQELSQALMGIRINDLFSERGKGEYKTLDAIYQNKGTLRDRWFTMTGDGKISADDPLTGEQNSYTLFEKPAVMEYKVALDKYRGRKAEADKAEVLEDDELDMEDDDEDSIPF